MRRCLTWVSYLSWPSPQYPFGSCRPQDLGPAVMLVGVHKLPVLAAPVHAWAEERIVHRWPRMANPCTFDNTGDR
jgi:hypothetical protein